MDTSTSLRELEAVRQRRAELREALDQFQRSLSGPGLASAVDRLASEFALHVEVTEGPGGLHQAILAGDLRLANQVATLAGEHGPIAAEIAALAAAPDAADAAERGTALVERLEKHRQRGADLIYEAYQTDIGGGD
jgi:hypothetical protein